MDIKSFIASSSPKGWLVKQLIPKGHAVIISGMPGVGKSWIVDMLAICIASGKPFLELETTQGTVILVDEDTPSDEVANRLLRLAKGIEVKLEEIPIIVHSMEGLNISNTLTLEMLRADIAKTKAILIIFDCLSKVMGGGFNEDSSRDANKASTAWNDLKAAGATILITHHLNKRDGSLATDFVKLSRGSAAIVSNSDTAFGVETGRRNPTCFNIYPIERRKKLGIRTPFSIKLEEDTGLEWANLRRITMTKEISNLAKDLASIFLSSKGDDKNFTTNDIKKKLAGAASDLDIRNALHELEDKGILKHSILEHNRYIYSPATNCTTPMEKP